MTRRLLILALITGLAGCAWFRDPPEQGISTGATVVYNGGGFKVFSVCDRGNLVYSSEKNPQVYVVPGGCNAGAPGSPSPAGVAAVTERTPERERAAAPPVAAPVAAPPITFPQPFVIHLVTPPSASADAAAAEPRAPIVIQVLPAPTAGEPPVIVCPPSAPVPKVAPKAAPPQKKGATPC
jgi:hypothetical protein